MQALSAFKNLATSTNQTWFASLLVLLRITIGGEFLLSGLQKISGWTAEGYLLNATAPFENLFHSMAGSVIVDQLVLWGLILIGIALILGLMVRPASFFGAVLMLLIFLAHFSEYTKEVSIDIHLIHIVIFVLFMSGGVGHIFGLDGVIYGNMRKKRQRAKLLFG